MALTAHGFWYPDPATPMGFQPNFSAAATAAEAANRVSYVRDGVPKAASEALLTAVFTGTTDPVTGLALAPVVGSQGSVNGVPVTWNGTRWWAPGYNRMDILKTANSAAANTTWTKYAALGTVATDSNGTGLTLQADGIKVLDAGTYHAAFVLQFSTNVVGQRMAALSTNSAAPSGGQWRVNANATLGAFDTGLAAAADLTLSANDVINVYGWQNAGGALNMTQCSLWVHRIG